MYESTDGAANWKFVNTSAKFGNCWTFKNGTIQHQYVLSLAHLLRNGGPTMITLVAASYALPCGLRPTHKRKVATPPSVATNFFYRGLM